MKERRGERSFALVSTLLIVAVMALGALAFFQAARMDRLVTRNTADRVRAELAAESGLAQAQALLANAIGTNRNFIVMSTSPVAGYSPILMVGTRDTGILTNFLPLISGDLGPYLANRTNTTLATFLAIRTNTNTFNTANLNVGGNFIQDTSTPNWNVFTNAVPSLQPNWASTWYRAPWVYLTNLVTNGAVVQTNLVRFAFLVMDEQARLNPLIHAGLTAEARTNFGRSAAEVVMDASGAAVFSSSNVRSSYNSQAGGVLTPGNLGLVIGTNAFQQVKHLISLHQAVDEDLIPDGYLTNSTNPASFVAYADAGRPKYNLNDLVLNNTNGPAQAATNIGSIIQSNLPSFFLRDLGSQTSGLANTFYPNRLAASIVDYIDTDTASTLVNGGEPAGKELAPYVVMIGERNTLVSETPAIGPAPVTVRIRSEFFAQLWNPHTVPVTGQAILQITGRQPVELRGGGPITDFNDFTSASTPVTVRPNEILAVAFGQDEQNFTHPTQRPSSSTNFMATWSNTSSASGALTGHPQFRMRWNGTDLDMNRQKPEMADPANSGLPRSTPAAAFRLPGAVRWQFSVTSERSGGGGMRAVGDPRANFTVSYDWADRGTTLTNALWQGLQNPPAGSAARQNFSTLWAARDFVRADGPFGTPLANSNANPSAITSTWTAASGNNAPSFIRNAPMLSIAELGHIFDPAQVDDSGIAPSAATPPNFLGSVGGRSLRIGQPESQYWATNAGQQAMRLLDLFTVNPIGTSAIPTNSPAWARNYWNGVVTNGVYTNIPLMVGRINVNTAPPEVLSAVFSGIQITSDAGLGSNNPVRAGASQGLITALITNRPYSRISDLQKAMSGFANATNFTWSTTVANAATNAGNPAPAMAAMDRAREELFTKSVNLLTTQSRAFRVYVVGQALGRRTNPIGQVAVEASVLLEPQGTTNSFTGMRPRVVFRKIQ